MDSAFSGSRERLDFQMYNKTVLLVVNGLSHVLKKESNIMGSNMIKGVKSPGVFISFVFGILLMAGCDQQEAPDSSEADPVVTTWIQEAAAIAEKIPTDLHAVEHDRSLSRTAVTALELGIYDQTDNILKSIHSWRKADLYAKLAGTCYLAGKMKEGDELIEKAHRYLREHQFEEWQVSRVHVGIEEAGHIKGEKTDGALLRQLEPSDQARLLPSMVKGNLSTTNLVDMLTRLEASTNAVMDIDIASATIDTYRLMYEKSQQKEELKELRTRVLDDVEKTFRNVHRSIACSKLLDFCDSAVSAGDDVFINRLCSMLEDRLDMIRIDMRIPVLLRYSDFLIKQGKNEKALKKLSYIEDNIKDPAIYFADRPVFLARCGVLYGKAGDNRKMSELVQASIAQLNTFKNARPRAVTAVDICHIFARAKLDSPEILNSMKELDSNLSDPW